jgi:hypothetical protein
VVACVPGDGGEDAARRTRASAVEPAAGEKERGGHERRTGSSEEERDVRAEPRARDGGGADDGEGGVRVGGEELGRVRAARPPSRPAVAREVEREDGTGHASASLPQSALEPPSSWRTSSGSPTPARRS